MPILSARFIKDGLVREYDRREITPQLYNSTLKGNLYCPTSNCNARIVYNSGVRSFLRTWSFDDHTEDCPHRFERTKGRVGVDTSKFITVQLSDERKKRALKEALKRFKMSSEELEAVKPKHPLRRNPSTTSRKVVPASVAVIQGDESSSEGEQSFRGPNLSKRTPDMLKDNDLGKPRLIMGNLESISISGDVANIVVEENGAKVSIKFEEVFRANSPEYLGLFHHISDYIHSEELSEVVITAIGEVKKADGSFELSVFYGHDLEINGYDLRQLAIRNAL